MTEWKSTQPRFLKALLEGDADAAVMVAREALSSGAKPVEFFEGCIAPSLAEVGKRFETLEIFLPEMVTAAEAVDKVNAEVIKPALEVASAEAAKVKGRVLLATVQGDLHDIGKNMVGLMLKVNGFEVIDLGTNVSPSDIVASAKKEGVDIIGLSALLTTCLPYMKDVCDFLVAKGARGAYRVVVGGAATTPDFAKEVGADAHGDSAADAVAICTEMMVDRAQRHEKG
jgi:5-methyltetrahydrofolate--homocysteine methyltransferase